MIVASSALSLLLAVAVPHHHGKSSVAHPESSCRICKLQEQFSVAPLAAAIVTAQLVLIEICVLRPSNSPRARLVPRSASSRAPPSLS